MGKLNYRIPNTNDFREIYVKVTDTLPIGAVCQYGGSTAPSGYLMCNGQAVSRTTYADLFKAIGTSFGSGDGVTTFNVPNFNGRVPVGLDGTDTDFDTVGETGGSKYLQEHSHSAKNGANFAVNTGFNAVAQGNWGGSTNDSRTTTGGVSDVTTGNSGNLQPYIVINYIIKATKKVALDKGNVVDSLDGSDTDSAPSVRAVNEALVETYSTDEVKTNKVWIDGKPIYRKVIIVNNLEINNTTIINTNITNLETAISIKGIYKVASEIAFSYPLVQNNGTIINCVFNSNHITFNGNETYSQSTGRTHIFILEYTKTTD